MSVSTSTSRTKTLNHRAPEYKPIPPGITPHRPHQPPPFPLPWSSSAAIRHRPPPPPLVWSPQLLSYIIPPSLPYTTQNPSNYVPSYNIINPQFQVATNPSPPPPPPQAAASPRSHPDRRSCPGQRGEIQAHRGRGKPSFRTRDERINERGLNNRKFENRANYSNEISNVGYLRDHGKYTVRVPRRMQKEEISCRHKVTPLKRNEENTTTIMIKNIPYHLPRQEIINLLDGFCKMENETKNDEGTSHDHEENLICAYDFVYLPIDFKTNKGRGFAFVNFTNPRAVRRFFDRFHLKTWDFVEFTKYWPKMIVIVSAKIQGKEALVNHLSQSIFECERNDFLPLCFHPPRDGSGQPVELTVIGERRRTRAISPWEPRIIIRPKP